MTKFNEIETDKGNSYQFNIKNFDGPLDLLLFLIKDNKMDIFDINLIEIAEQYLKYIAQIKDEDLEQASEYLVMAATLLHLKSRALLERPEEKVALEIDKKQLLKQLADYQQFKMIKDRLRQREEVRMQVFTKDPEDLSSFVRPEDPSKLDGNSDPVKLIMILRKMFERTHAQKLASGTIDNFNLSPEERAEDIRSLLRYKKELKFEEVFDVASLKHFLVTVLALLDLARKQEIILDQKIQFGEIRIFKGEGYGK